MSPVSQPENRFALKEWAVVVRALAEGRQTLLLRKGGIRDRRGRFSVDHSEFFLYPTYLHEQAGRIVPEASDGLRAVMAGKPPDDRLALSIYGAVRESVWVSDLGRVSRLAPFHILSSNEIERRFFYRNQPGLFVVLLRVFRVVPARWVPVIEAYKGCRSWVTLETPLPTFEALPVIEDQNYLNLFNEIKGIL